MALVRPARAVDGALVVAVADLFEEDPTLASHLYHSLAVMLARRLRDRTNEALAH